METTSESVTSNAKNTEQNTLSDTNSKKDPTTLTPPVPNVIMLGLLFLSTIGIIIAGYIHGKMHLLTVLKNAIE
tara:strand:- start:1299 stop:1520 length:222 start_codon:yes stop_codon:yes gene_type:complete